MDNKRLSSTRREVLTHMGAGALLTLLPTEAPAAAPPQNLSDLLEPLRTENDLPALAALVLKNGETVGLGAVGVRKIGDRTRVTIRDKFHLGSCTKALTAHLCAALMEEGLLNRTTTLAEALPEMAATMHPSYRTVTLDHLLSHFSGFPAESWLKGRDFQETRRFPGTPAQQRENYVYEILQEKPESEPGKKCLYSNRNYAVAGVLAERAARQEWEPLMQRKVFRPLGMYRVGFGAMGTPGLVDQPWQHAVPGWNGEERTIIGPGPNSDNPAPLGPGGTAHMPIDDWARFVQDHLSGLRGGEGGLLKKASYPYLHTPLFGGTYMGGWSITDEPLPAGRCWSHTGSNTQNFAHVWLTPAQNFAVLAMTNQGGEKAQQACQKVIELMKKTFLTA